MPLGNRHTSPAQLSIAPESPHHRRFPFRQMFTDKLHSIFGKDDSRCHSPQLIDDHVDLVPWPGLPGDAVQKLPPSMKDRERPITGLPRQTTFKRQNSERRERLCPAEPFPEEKRALSASRHISTSCIRRRRTRSTPPPSGLFRSLVSVASTTLSPNGPIASAEQLLLNVPLDTPVAPPVPHPVYNDNVFDYQERPSRPVSRASSLPWLDHEQHRDLLQHELDTKWILNLSMHFRDKSDREKFFVTYAETPTRWRRVTVSCDYRNAEPASLEIELKELQFQRDKSLAVYEAIRESLADIQFYDSVTNLKLETCDGRLHVHVTEDVNEIIPYPARSMVRHVLDDLNSDARPMEICEKDLVFDAHLSGFVYRVLYHGQVYIKKEIPSPDTIDEFLYEINALHALYESEQVIKLEAIILDDARQVVKGLLIGFAEQGAVVDILYDFKGKVPWQHRERWARQATIGLRDIHEEGYVQGDFTLSNVVIDHNNDAKIIDINRRGCPVGWEPPEIAQKISSNQRISMYIGEKSDLYQLGMTLWALAMDDDEPERHDPPLSTEYFKPEIPEWFRNVVRICLSPKPRDRLPAKELVHLFPTRMEETKQTTLCGPIEPRAHPNLRTATKQYIDPNAAVERDDIERFKQVDDDDLLYSPQSSQADWRRFTYPKSSQYDVESVTSAAEVSRGRRRGSYERRPSRNQEATLTPIEVEGHELPYPTELELMDDMQSPNKFDGMSGLAILEPVAQQALKIDEVERLTESDTIVAVPPTDAFLSNSFRLPNWKRSRSESTPRDSKVRLHSMARSLTPDPSPRTTLLALPQHSSSADQPTSARSSNDTIAPCDASIIETSCSDTTCFTQALATVSDPTIKLEELHGVQSLPLTHGPVTPSQCPSEPPPPSDNVTTAMPETIQHLEDQPQAIT